MRFRRLFSASSSFSRFILEGSKAPYLLFLSYSVARLMPCLRHSSAAVTPASACFNTAMISTESGLVHFEFLCWKTLLPTSLRNQGVTRSLAATDSQADTSDTKAVEISSMRLKYSILLLALLTAPLPAHSAGDFQGKLIFAVQVLESSMNLNADGSKYPKERTGIFYYCEESGPGECEPYTLQGYKLENGRITGRAGDDSLLKELKSIPLSSFNVQEEIDSTILKGRAEAARNGAGFPNWMVADGAKYRILYDFNGVKIDHTAWNPSLGIKILAAYSSNLKNLNDLLNLFALDYGLSQLW